MTAPRFLLLAILLLAFGFAQYGQAVDAQESTNSTAIDASPDDIQQLIAELGDDRYVIRVRAKEKLQMMGLEAFEELRQAKDHDDSEIAVAAHYLISSLLVSWSKESDPAAVREALSEYGAQDPPERESRIGMLAKLGDRQGLEALVRLARFETDLSLSRMAALKLMQQPMSVSDDVRQQNSKVVLSTLKKSDRRAADWLRVYAKDLADGTYSTDDWRELLKKQRRDLDAGTAGDANRVSVLELIRICAVRAAAAGKRPEGLRLAEDNMDLIQPTTRDLVEASSWAIDNSLHEFVLALRSKNARLFKTHALLLYGAAQAEKLNGNDVEAERLAIEALAINGFPADKAALDALSSNAAEEIAQAHLLVAEELSQRGLFDWARNEYQHIVGNIGLTSIAGVRTRGRLADMLGELQLHDEVIATLQPLMDRINKDEVLRNRMRMSLINLSYFQSQLDFHKGLKAEKQGDVDAAKRYMRSAYNEFRSNIDILIAMYRLNSDDDGDWKKTVKRDLAGHVRSIESEMHTLETRFRELGGRPDDVRMLSQSLNEYAWLVSNTEGDYKRALKASLRSLELTPDDGAKTDTLARCYIALGEYEKARAAQVRAVELMPHSPPMLRQLEEIDRLIETNDDDESDK